MELEACCGWGKPEVTHSLEGKDPCSCVRVQAACRQLRWWVLQDRATAECISQHSYNELVSLIVECLGEDATPLQTPKAKAASASSNPAPGEGAAWDLAGSSGGSSSAAAERLPMSGRASEAGREPEGCDSGTGQDPSSKPVDPDALSDALQVCLVSWAADIQTS